MLGHKQVARNDYVCRGYLGRKPRVGPAQPWASVCTLRPPTPPPTVGTQVGGRHLLADMQTGGPRQTHAICPLRVAVNPWVDSPLSQAGQRRSCRQVGLHGRIYLLLPVTASCVGLSLIPQGLLKPQLWMYRSSRG